MQQPGYAPQQYPPLSPGYPPQQAWYPPQQYVPQQPVMIQQGGYTPQQYQLSGKVKAALILAIVAAVFTTGAGFFWAVAISPWGGGVCLFFWWLAHGFGLGGAGCKNACLMTTYIVFGFIYAFLSFCLGCLYAYFANVASDERDRYISISMETKIKQGHTKNDKSVWEIICIAKYGTMFGSVEECLRNDFIYSTALSALLFIITILFATSAGFFIRARSEVKAQEFQTAFGGQPPVVPYTGTGSQTQRTA